MIVRRTPLVLGFAGALAACTAKISGDLQVDGNAFAITECRSGAAFGFSGVVFGTADGRRLRLITNADGTTSAAIFPPSADSGDALGLCGTLSAHAQDSRINSIVNLKGTANLSCATAEHSISGKVEFENCH
jgi:hypothetical protein